MRCDLKDEKEPPLGKGTGGAGGRKGNPRRREKHRQEYSAPHALCWVVAETSPLKTRLCFILDKTCPNANRSKYGDAHKQVHF